MLKVEIINNILKSMCLCSQLRSHQGRVYRSGDTEHAFTTSEIKGGVVRFMHQPSYPGKSIIDTR
jgi:hypothetical protein